MKTSGIVLNNMAPHFPSRQLEEDFAVVEPKDEESAVERLHHLTKIVTEFQDHLRERATNHLGYPGNHNCSHYLGLSRLLQFNINNAGDPFKESDYGLHSKKFEVGVLDWFAQLWGIDKDQYWGYVTNGGTEANLHTILLGSPATPRLCLCASISTSVVLLGGDIEALPPRSEQQRTSHHPDPGGSGRRCPPRFVVVIAHQIWGDDNVAPIQQ
ncbi:UNVERIFIED_CONTAM: Serine decarboxylase 1 [Sesamum calycinum]|uniref:Serine decarboxylase 1 n=1 Tax=Sesamum calycinum TaxID=2727403 RepID=A0AAW2LXL6_9LAMI